MATTYGPRAEYIGNNSLAVYTFDFTVKSLEHLLIGMIDANLQLVFERRGNDLPAAISSVTLNSTDGGTVNLLANLPSGYQLYILQADDSPVQSSEFKNKNDFTLKRFEDALDKLSLQIQRLSYNAKRSLKLWNGFADSDTFDTALPIGSTNTLVQDNATKVLCVGTDNKSLALGPSVISLAAQALAAQNAADAAAASEANAANSATGANASAIAAAASATSAATSEANSDTSEANAATSAAAALVSENAAAVSATAAAASQVAAALSATNAANSATAAASSESNSAISAAAALVSQNAAATSATNAATSETNAATSETNAATSATDAANSAASAAANGGGAPAVTGSRAVPQNITAGGGIAFTGTSWFNMWFVQGSGGAVDITVNPQIAAGSVVGQRLSVYGRSDVNTLLLDDGTGLDLNGPCVLGASSAISLYWDGTNWVEEGRR